MPIINLIDSDILVYKVAFSVQSPIYVVKGGIYKRRGYAELMSKKTGFPISKRENFGSIGDLRKNLYTCMRNISEDLGGGYNKHFLTSSKVQGNFRKDVATILPYKGNRVGAKPFFYNTMRKILHEEFGAMLVHGQEADDQIAIEQTEIVHKYDSYEHSCIVSIDKDIRTIPGYHYNITTRIINEVSYVEALKNFYKQLLYGDATDNIPGLTKVLKIKGREEEANKLSYGKYMKKFEEDTIEKSPEETFEYIINMYESRGLLNEMWEIGNLLWLRRYPGQIWSTDMQKVLI